MNKQQQIEENAKVIPEKIKDPLDNSRYIIFGKSLRREIARIYYNAGYRKLPEDSIILSRKEYEKLKYTWITDSDAYKKGCKETAEKYNDGVVEFIKNIFDIGQIDFKTKIELLKENEKILKQFAVEIKEL